MKKYIIKVIYILSPLFITTILGILQGGWFDTEKYIEQGDIEVYTPSITHYVFFRCDKHITVISFYFRIELLMQ